MIGGRDVTGLVSWFAQNATDQEKPVGDWNTLDLYVLGDRAIHVVNGVPVLEAWNICYAERTFARCEPLTHGFGENQQILRPQNRLDSAPAVYQLLGRQRIDESIPQHRLQTTEPLLRYQLAANVLDTVALTRSTSPTTFRNNATKWTPESKRKPPG